MQPAGIKREASSEDPTGAPQDNPKRWRSDRMGSDRMGSQDVTLRCLLQSKSAGGIIGKGGQNIKRLRTEYFLGPSIVQDLSYLISVLSIQAVEKKAIAILIECLPQMGPPPYSGTNQGPAQDEFEINFLIHSSQAGSVIGSGGSKIKELRERSGCQIKIYSECLPNATERVVAIAGTEQQISSALENILETMSKTPIKGPVHLYDPSDANDYDEFGGIYGGGGGGPRGMRGGMGGGMRGGMGGRGGGGRGGGGGGGGMRGGRGGYSGGRGGGGPPIRRGPPAMPVADEQVGYAQQIGDDGSNYTDFQDPLGGATQVTIPKGLAGAIIGRGGERIRNIRMQSGAEIKIEEANPDMKDRIITIKGDPEQIQHAQFLMQQR
eukprot:gene9592-10579_t